MITNNQIYLLLLLLLCLTTGVLQAQVGGNIYDKNRNKRYYNRYDIDQFIEQQKKAQEELKGQQDTTLQDKLLTTPEELRKLGVPEEIIEQIEELNAVQDTLNDIREEDARQALDAKLGAGVDSISLEDIETLIEFQKKDLIDKALSLPTPIVYGQEFFRRNTMRLLFDTDSEVRPPANYQLGTNDQLSVAMWGAADFNQVFTINKEGVIDIPLVGRVYLKGMTLASAKALVKQKIANTYDVDDEKIDVSITFTRIINVNFVGELINPGTYRVPASSSVFNILVAIDGPDQLGSLRKIYVKRQGKTIKTLDVYAYLNNPDSNEDFFLEENDYVVVPPSGSIVNVSGQVKREHNYEITGDEGLLQIIDYAGGLEANAFTKNINIKRYQNNRAELIDVNLDSLVVLNSDFPLANGDSIFIYPVSEILTNYVEVVGAVKVPGRYEIKPGDRVSDVLYKTEGVLEEADLSRAYVVRLKQDRSKQILPFDLGSVMEEDPMANDILLQSLDTIQIVNRESFRQNFTVKISGAVRQAGEYEFAEGLTLKDLLYLAGGMKKQAASNRLEVSRLINFTDDQKIVEEKQRIVIKRVEVNPDLSIDQTASSFNLRPYDHVFVRFSPNFEEPQTIKIYGEIIYPGEYTMLSKEETLLHVIDRAGGLSDFAFREGARLYRNEDSIGYVLLDLEKAIKKPTKSKFNYILTNGDSIFVPKVKNIVTLAGAVGFFDVDSTDIQISVPFSKNRKRAKYYINNHGGGFGRYAKKKRTYVIQANGEVVKTRNLGFTKIYPKVDNGAIVFVDITDKKRKEALRAEQRKNRNWNDAFDSLTSKIATILTVLVLVQQASR